MSLEWRQIVGPLRRRFFVLLGLLGLLSLGPVFLGLLARSHLTGRAQQVDLAGTLRYRLFAIALAADANHPDQVRALLNEQRQTFTSLTQGDAKTGLPACASAAVCEHLRDEMAFWDHVVAPTAREVADGRGHAETLRGLLFGDLERMNHLVAVIQDAHERRVNGLLWWGILLSAGSLLGVIFVAYGVWDVFARIRRLKEASRSPADEARIGVQAKGYDEVADLAETIAADLRDQRTQAQEQLALFAELGRLLAHEARNPLNNMSLTLSLVERAATKLAANGDCKAIQDKLALLRADLARLDTLVGDFLRLPTTGDVLRRPGEGARETLAALRKDTQRKLASS